MGRFDSIDALLNHVLKVDHKIASDLASGHGIRGLMDLQCFESSKTTMEHKLAVLRRLQEIGVNADDVAAACTEVVQKHGYAEPAAHQAVYDGALALLDRAVYHYKDPKAAKKKPRLGVAVFGTNPAGLLLLGQRGKQPNYGKLVLPGGGVEFGETLEDAARREVKEETGLEIDLFVPELQYVHEVVEESEHRVTVVLRARMLPGDPKASTDLLDAAYYQSDKIPFNDVSDVVKPILRRFGWVLN
jgi:8-oxo-dGTP diphosphatase